MGQQMVSIGTFELVVLLKVLFAKDSPIDASPFDELEWGWPCVVLSLERLLFSEKNLAIAEYTFYFWNIEIYCKYSKCVVNIYLYIDKENIHCQIEKIINLALLIYQQRKSERVNAIYVFYYSICIVNNNRSKKCKESIMYQ